VPEPRRKRVLFVCVENSNRSQLAEAFARMHGGAGVDAFSAGSRPSGRVNPRAVEFDAVIGMGCGDEACLLIPARMHEEWDVPDPKEMPPEQYREVRDLIERKVRDLLARL
jgi:protein-tyrosine-phosphatase